jgi:hypothetical protein
MIKGTGEGESQAGLDQRHDFQVSRENSLEILPLATVCSF